MFAFASQLDSNRASQSFTIYVLRDAKSQSISSSCVIWLQSTPFLRLLALAGRVDGIQQRLVELELGELGHVHTSSTAELLGNTLQFRLEFSLRLGGGVNQSTVPVTRKEDAINHTHETRKTSGDNSLGLGLVLANLLQEQLLNGIADFLGGRNAHGERTTSDDSTGAAQKGFGQHLFRNGEYD